MSSILVDSKTGEVKSTENIRFRGNYTFIREPIPRINALDDSLLSYLRSRRPVVISGSNILGPAQSIWNVEFLEKNVIGSNLTTFISETRRFLYYEKERNKGNYTWTPPHRRHSMSFENFTDIVRELTMSENMSKAYLQTALDVADFSETMQDHVFQFNYVWLNEIARQAGWGDIDTNLLLVGMPDVVTPAHYDSMENFFAQISGHKRCILFNPLQYRNLYPYPVHHPHDRQSQVNFDDPDLDKFPRFRQALGYEAVVGPGDLLYIPINWWHYIESNSNSMTVSLNFWFSNTAGDEFVNEEANSMAINGNAKIKNEPKEEELLQLMREIENAVGESLQDSKEVKSFLLDIIDRRFDFLE
jgi:hypoxia-inducible factor 1-alpha inhibitor (HIF hydroxylase)